MLHLAWHWAEPWMALAIVIVALCSAPAGDGYWRWFGRLARRKWLAIVAVTILAFGGALTLTIVRGAPVPMIHDEFTYLLQADTYAHGRLANPPHEMAEFFDTFHVIQKPTYAGKYPPAQGLFLAMGQRLGHPVVGVWISFALCCGALCWMLQAWLPPRWALTGALLMLVRLLSSCGIQQWAYGYWGGAATALGGALLFGAGRRLWKQPDLRYALVLASALALLANSRPLEGLVASIFMCGALAWRYFIQRPFAMTAVVGRVALPALLVLLPAAMWMGYYNLKVTGNWRKLPYREHLEQYTQVPILLWQPRVVASKTYSNLITQVFHDEYEAQEWNQVRQPGGVPRLLQNRLSSPAVYFLGWMLAPMLALGVFTIRPWPLFATLTVGGALVVGLQTSWFMAHYLAPVAPLIIYLIVAGLRRAWHWTIVERAVGRSLVTSVLAAYVLLGASCLVPPLTPLPYAWNLRRQALAESLAAEGGQHLIIVRYQPDHIIHNEWVYNAADIDRAPIVWAREKEPAKMKQLLAYFHDRHIWLLEADRELAQPVPYPTDTLP